MGAKYRTTLKQKIKFISVLEHLCTKAKALRSDQRLVNKSNPDQEDTAETLQVLLFQLTGSSKREETTVVLDPESAFPLP